MTAPKLYASQTYDPTQHEIPFGTTESSLPELKRDPTKQQQYRDQDGHLLGEGYSMEWFITRSTMQRRASWKTGMEPVRIYRRDIDRG